MAKKKHGLGCKCLNCTIIRKQTARAAAKATGAVISGAMTIGQAMAEPQQGNTNTQGNWADSSAQSRGTDAARGYRSATRDAGVRRGDLKHIFSVKLVYYEKTI